MNEKLIIILGVTITVMILFTALRGRSRYKYAKQTFLLTKAELHFYKTLLIHFKSDYEVFAKVRVADVIKPERTDNSKRWWSAFGKVSQKHFDFVLCDKETLDVLFCIELNDRSHSRSDRSKRDAFLDDACKTAGVRLLWIPASRRYDKEVFGRMLKDQRDMKQGKR